jgi:hypothetical protein
MSCPEPVITPSGRSGIGVIQPQSGLDYPLVAPSADIRYLIADFYLAYDDPGVYRATIARRKHPLRIKWLYGVGCAPAAAPGWAPTPTHAADILIVDEVDNVVFDSTQLVPAGGDTNYQSYRNVDWGDDLVIYEWIGNNGVCRLVVYKTWPPAFEIEPTDWPTHIAPENAVLDERAVYKMPRRVRALKIVSENFVAGVVKRAGAVLAAGYNMRIETAASVDSLRNNTNITLHAEPGTGLGKYDDCPDSGPSPVLRINGATPNEHGDFTMSGPDCIWIRQPTEIVGSRAVPQRAAGAVTLQIGSNCPPCCDCPDYVETGRYMNRVAGRYATVGRNAHQVKLLHEGNIDRWIAQRDCRLSRPLRLQLVAQNCPLMDVVAMYCNQCQPCAEGVTLQVDFSSFPLGADAELECGYAFLYAPNYHGRAFTLRGDYPLFEADLPPLEIGSSAYIKFRLRFAPKTVPFAISATLSGYTPAGALRAGCDETDPAATATDTATLNCAPDGSTIQNCDANT